MKEEKGKSDDKGGKPQIPEHFRVKRTLRPNFDENILKDLEKIKQSMQTKYDNFGLYKASTQHKPVVKPAQNMGTSTSQSGSKHLKLNFNSGSKADEELKRSERAVEKLGSNNLIHIQEQSQPSEENVVEA